MKLGKRFVKILGVEAMSYDGTKTIFSNFSKTTPKVLSKSTFVKCHLLQNIVLAKVRIAVKTMLTGLYKHEHQWNLANVEKIKYPYKVFQKITCFV